MIEKNSRIFLAGHTGLVGSAILRKLQGEGFDSLLLPTIEELDLTEQERVRHFFREEKPQVVMVAAAKVGGIYANSHFPAEFIYSNLVIAVNLIHCAWEYGVEKLLFLGSSCIYPRLAPQPLKEEYLLSGYLEPTNEPYAIAKIAGIKMCQSYNRQYGTNFICAMPTNLFGPRDNFDLQSSHVLPALIRKFHEAKVQCEPEVVVWGTGAPRREFLYVDDLADACLFLMKSYDANPPEALGKGGQAGEIINVGTGEDLTIRELAELVGEVVGYRGAIRFDTSKPDGMPRKLLDVSRINALGWKAMTPLREGIAKAYNWFKSG